MPKMLETLTMCASPRALKVRQERARAMHDAPEIDVHQPVDLRLVDLVKLTEQGDAGVVHDDVEFGMAGDCGLGELLDLRRLRDVEPMNRDFSLMRPLDLVGERCEARFVHIRHRDVAAARCELKRQRAADAACGAGDCGGRARNRRHPFPLDRFPHASVHCRYGADQEETASSSPKASFRRKRAQLLASRWLTANGVRSAHSAHRDRM